MPEKKEKIMKTGAVIMASGLSKRMGENKLLLRYKGKTFIETILEKVLNCDFYLVNLVTSHVEIEKILREDYDIVNEIKVVQNIEEEKPISCILPELAEWEKLPQLPEQEELLGYPEISVLTEPVTNKKIIITMNQNPHAGISESIKLGIKKLKSCDAYMFFTGDQPELTIETIKKIMDKAGRDKIIVPRYNRKNGSPVLFGADFRDELLSLEGDTGGKQIIKRYVNNVEYLDIENPREGFDIDTKEEYESLISEI